MVVKVVGEYSGVGGGVSGVVGSGLWLWMGGGGWCYR